MFSIPLHAQHPAALHADPQCAGVRAIVRAGGAHHVHGFGGIHGGIMA